MKKFVAMGVLALALAAFSQQQASAWINAKFGVGMNIGWQSGGNNLLWGAFRNGQPPAPAGYHPGYYPGPGYQLPPGAADYQPAPTAPAAAPAAPAAPQSSIGRPDFHTVSYPGYYPVNYYVPAYYGQ